MGNNSEKEIDEDIQKDIMDEVELLSEKFDSFSDSVLAQLEGLHEKLGGLEERLQEKIENAVLEAGQHQQHADDDSLEEEVVEGLEKVSGKIDDLDSRLEEIEQLLEEE